MYVFIVSEKWYNFGFLIKIYHFNGYMYWSWKQLYKFMRIHFCIGLDVTSYWIESNFDFLKSIFQPLNDFYHFIYSLIIAYKYYLIFANAARHKQVLIRINDALFLCGLSVSISKFVELKLIMYILTNEFILLK